jgi:flagellar hook assembly protein FlgD
VLPGRTVLHRSYPNPFSTSAIIRYDLARDDGVSLRIYDGKGALVKVLYDGRRHAGCYEAVWMGENDGGRLVAAGIYFCRLQTREGFTQARKVLLIR